MPRLGQIHQGGYALDRLDASDKCKVETIDKSPQLHFILCIQVLSSPLAIGIVTTTCIFWQTLADIAGLGCSKEECSNASSETNTFSVEFHFKSHTS